MRAFDNARRDREKERLVKIRDTPLDCWRKSTQAHVYRLYAEGVDMETIAEQVNHFTHEQLDVDEVSHIIDKLNEIYL